MGKTNSSRQEKTVLQIFIFKEGRFWGTECFSQPMIQIGRSPDVDLQLDDDIVSRSHAEIKVVDDSLTLEDLGSSNGTFVNGEPVERCTLDARDEVSIGSFTLKMKLLTKKKPEGRARGETKIAGKDEPEAVREDQTEIVQPEAVNPDMMMDDSDPGLKGTESRHEDIISRIQRRGGDDLAPPRSSDERREEIAAALREELGQGGDFEAPTTASYHSSPEGVAQKLDEDLVEDDYETQILPEHEASEQKAKPNLFASLKPKKPKKSYPEKSAKELSVKEEPQAEIEEKREIDTVPEQDVDEAIERLEAMVKPGLGKPASAPRELDAFEPEGQESAESLELEDEGLAYQAEPGGALADEDEDEEDANFVEPFSLLNNLVRENFQQPQIPTEPTTILEVITYNQEKKVKEYRQLLVGEKYFLEEEGVVLAHHASGGTCKLMITDSMSGGLIIDGQTVPTEKYKNAKNEVRKRSGISAYACSLYKGDYANLRDELGGWFLRFAEPPRLPPVERFKPDKLFLGSLTASMGAHVMIALVLFGLPMLFPDCQGRSMAQQQTELFAKIDLKDLEIEKPEQEPEVPLDELPPPEQKPEEVKVETPQEQPKPTKAEKIKPTKRTKTKGNGGGGDGGGGGGMGMMAALGNLSQKTPSTNIVTAVTNLDAVRVPGGHSRYKVSGLVTKLPSSSVVLSRGQGVGVKGGIDLLRGGKGKGGMAGIGPGGLGGGLTGKRGVGGVVFKAPASKMRVRGYLSREEIAKVVRAHLREIQYCYEKQLLLNPNLQGKVIMEWTITTSGSVSIVKTQQNTMTTPNVAMCISSNIKNWKFPTPKGGIVIVSYPFIFNSIGF